MADGPTPVPSEGQNVKAKLLKSKPRYQEKIMNTFWTIRMKNGCLFTKPVDALCTITNLTNLISTGEKLPLSFCIGTIHKRRRHFFRFFDLPPSPMSALFYLHQLANIKEFLPFPLQIADVFYGWPHGSILQSRIFIHNINIDSTKVWSFTHQILIENMSNSMWPLTPGYSGYIWNEIEINFW